MKNKYIIPIAVFAIIFGGLYYYSPREVELLKLNSAHSGVLNEPEVLKAGKQVDSVPSAKGVKTLNRDYLASQSIGVIADTSKKKTSLKSVVINTASGTALAGSAYKAYTFSGTASQEKIVSMLAANRVAPAQANKLSQQALSILKSKNFGAGTLAVSAGALVYTAQQGWDIDINYKILISLGAAIVVFLLVRLLQEKGILS